MVSNVTKYLLFSMSCASVVFSNDNEIRGAPHQLILVKLTNVQSEFGPPYIWEIVNRTTSSSQLYFSDETEG